MGDRFDFMDDPAKGTIILMVALGLEVEDMTIIFRL